MARGSTPGLQKTIPASADLSAAAKQFTAVVMSGDQTVDTSGANGSVVGVQQNLPKSGRGTVVRLGASGGTTKLRVNGNSVNIAAGDMLKSDGSGLGVVAATTDDTAFAIAMEAATADDLIIEAILIGLRHIT